MINDKKELLEIQIEEEEADLIKNQNILFNLKELEVNSNNEVKRILKNSITQIENQIIWLQEIKEADEEALRNIDIDTADSIINLYEDR